MTAPTGGVAEFLGARAGEDGTVEFALGEHLHGAFGGVFGGAVAAACVFAARPAAPERRPFSLHVTFLRGLSTPTCRATAAPVASGRTVTTVGVDLTDEAGKPAARATVTFAAGEALHDLSDGGRVAVPDLAPYDDGTPVPITEFFDPPIVKVMQPRMVGTPAGGYAHAMRIPWDRPGAAAEAACMAADFCVGVPVGAALRGEFVPMPNPDLSVRFLGDAASDVLVGVGRLGRVDRGIAGTAVEVWDGTDLLAIGLSSTVLLGGIR